MLESRFEVLNALAQELRAQGLDVSVDPETVCVGRKQWDKYSQQILVMLSAAPVIVAGTKEFFVFASEQYDGDHSLKKYSITLCDSKKRPLESWDLDTKRGPHKHIYIDYSKNPAHLRFEGGIKEIAWEMLDVMRRAKPEEPEAGQAGQSA